MTNIYKRRNLILFTSTLCLLFAGIIYAWSIFKSPLEKEFGWQASQLALNFTLVMCFFCVGGLVSGLISKKTSSFIRMAIAAVLMFLGFWGTSRLNADTLWLLYLSYGITLGAGIGIAYNTILSTTSAWFPDEKGFCSGTMLLGFGFSTLLIGNVVGQLLSNVVFSWRDIYFVLGIISAVITLLAGLVIKPPSDDIVLPAVKKDAVIDGENYTVSEMVKKVSFWKLFICFILLGSAGSAVISFAKDFSVSFGISDSLSVLLVGILSLFNGLGRLISGFIFDKLGMRKTQYITGVVSILAPSVALIAVLTNSSMLCITGLCLCGLYYGFVPTLAAAFTLSFFGEKNYALNFSIFNLYLMPTSFAATLAGNMLQTGGYGNVFIMLTTYAIISLFINLSIKKA